MSIKQKLARRLSASSSSPLSSPASNASPPPAALSNGHASQPPPLASMACTLKATGVEVTVVVDLDEVRIVKRSGNGKVLFAIPTLHILTARYLHPTVPDKTPSALQLTYLGPSAPHNLISLQLVPTPSSSAAAEPPVDPLAFLETLRKAAYPRTKPNRRVYLVVNPAGGQGKARKTAQKTVLPVLEAAGCTVIVAETTAEGHAVELARDLDVDQFDVIGCVSGDGVLHEVFNGLAGRKDARRCLRLPVVPVPCGSGNSLSLSLHGKVPGFNVALAALNLVKGTPLAMDLCSVTQGAEPRRISFLSTALGVMADLDLGTEHLRWMGDARFMYGFLRGVVTQPDWPGSVSMLVIESDKTVLSSQLRARLARDPLAVEAEKERAAEALGEEAESEGLPELKYTSGPGEGWVTLDGLEEGNELLYVYAGLTPVADRDLVQWPFSNPGDGLLNVAVQKKVARTTLLSAITTADHGGHIYEPSTLYYQVRALYIDPSPPRPTTTTPTRPLPLISIDGEAVPALQGPLMVEVHQGLGLTMSLTGRWHGADEFYKKGLRG